MGTWQRVARWGAGLVVLGVVLVVVNETVLGLLLDRWGVHGFDRVPYRRAAAWGGIALASIGAGLLVARGLVALAGRRRG